MATFAQAILDKTTEWIWLLKVEGGGFYRRYASRDVSVSEYGTSHFYEGRLDIGSEPTISTDPYTGRTSVMTAGIRINPRVEGETHATTPNRLQDEEEKGNFSWGQMEGKLYRYADKSIFTEAQLLLHGTFEGVELDSSGVTSLELRDFSSRYDVELPSVFVNEAILPGAQSDAYNAGYPIRYGKFWMRIAREIATAYKYVLLTIGHASSLDDCYKGGSQDASATLLNTNDADGNKVAVAITTATGDIHYASGVGQIDTTAQYTGTADAVITNPADIIHHLLRTYAEVPEDIIDAVSFNKVRGRWEGWELDLNIDDDSPGKAFDIIARLLYLMRGTLFFKDGKLTLKAWDAVSLSDYTITDQNRLETENINWGDYDQIYNDLTLGYYYAIVSPASWDEIEAAGHSLVHQVTRDSTTSQDLAESVRQYGEKSINFEVPETSNGATAAKILNGLMDLHYKMRKKIDVVCDTTSHDVAIYDTVSLNDDLGPSATGTGFLAKRTVCIGIEYGLYRNTLTLMEAD